MPDQAWTTEKEQEHFYMAYETRKIWAGSVTHYSVYRLFLELEEMMKNKMITIDQAKKIIDTYHQKWPSMEYRAKVVDAWGWGIIVPYGIGLERVITEYPQSVAIIGDVRSGKTVTSWTLIWKLCNQLMMIIGHPGSPKKGSRR